MQQCFQNMQSYENSLHTAEPLIAHLLSPNYIQVMIKDLRIFSVDVLKDSVTPVLPPDDLVLAH